MDEKDKLARFEEQILPHLDAAFNLARWLAHNEHDAQDVVQEAFLRAFKFFASFRGRDSRAWLLRIVRNTFYTWLGKHSREQEAAPFDEELHSAELDPVTPQTELLAQADAQFLRQAIDELPWEFRESLILRELEGLSYKEIADVANVPIGTVMSRLARARQQLRGFLLQQGERKG
jgi:RNA polymerase sigma-70 factor (ECF subfamily)